MDNISVNKSSTLVGFGAALVALGFFDSVSLDWLVVGHTKFSPDRMFGSVSKVLKTSGSFSHLEVAD